VSNKGQSIFTFYRGGKETLIKIRVTQPLELKSIGIHFTNDLMVQFSEFGMPVLDDSGLLSILKSPVENITALLDYSLRCTKEKNEIIASLTSLLAIVPLDKINKLIKGIKTYSHITSKKFPISESNYFYLHDVDRFIWTFYRDGEKTQIQMKGVPSIEFMSGNNYFLNDLMVNFSKFNIPMLDVSGISTMLDKPQWINMPLLERSSRCIKEKTDIIAVLASHSAIALKNESKELINGRNYE